MKDFVQYYSIIKGKDERKFRGRVRDLAIYSLSKWNRISKDCKKLLAQPRVQFLYLHHVFRDEENAFDLLIQKLAEDHVFISYTEAWKKILGNQIDRPYMVFSSDDGMKNNLSAARILERYGAAACFFVCPGITGERDFDKVAQFCREKLHFPPVEFMDWDDINALQRGGHEIGSHTMNHIRISETNPSILREEIGNSKIILDKNCGPTIHFAYPYGRATDISSLGRSMVFESGFQSCASAERGCHFNSAEPARAVADLMIKRDHIILDWPYHQVEYFLVRNVLKNRNLN